MNLQHRIDLLSALGQYILSDNDNWQAVKENAERENAWFTPEFITIAAANIATSFLPKDALQKWVAAYPSLADESPRPLRVGIVMAGNIPLVGFHDFLSVFISGHKAVMKPSSKDKQLIRHLADKLIEWEPGCAEHIQFADMLKGCDAYIATGSNNSSRYFEYYFSKFPNIIRKNRTSVAILTGQETTAELEKLADDVYLYFGLGCRNVTKLYVPEGYEFPLLLEIFSKYNHLADHHKYKNNYDYNLALHLLNKKYYMTNGSILLIEDEAVFSPISQLNYSYYTDATKLAEKLSNNHDIQCITGTNLIPFGSTQGPGLSDYADGIDTLRFLSTL